MLKIHNEASYRSILPITFKKFYNKSNEQDIERALESKIILILRYIFANDNVFNYNEEDKNTEILIDAAYSSIEATNERPTIIIDEISFTINCQSAVGGNYLDSRIDPVTGNSVRVFVTQIPFTFTAKCTGFESVSSNLANKLVNIFASSQLDMLSSENIQIHMVSKGPSGLKQDNKDRLFESRVSISGVTDWVVEKRVEPYQLKKINLKTVINEEK